MTRSRRFVDEALKQSAHNLKRQAVPATYSWLWYCSECYSGIGMSTNTTACVNYPCGKKIPDDPHKVLWERHKNPGRMHIPLKSERVPTTPKPPSELLSSAVAERARVLRCDECNKIFSSYVEHRAHLACHARAKSLARDVTNTIDPHLLQNSQAPADQPYFQSKIPNDADGDISAAVTKSWEEILATGRNSEFEDTNHRSYEQNCFQPYGNGGGVDSHEYVIRDNRDCDDLLPKELSYAHKILVDLVMHEFLNVYNKYNGSEK
jgi:hypothetical protein